MSPSFAPLLIPLVVVLPALLALGTIPAAGRGVVLRLAPWAPLPALLLAVLAPGGAPLELPWLLIGSRLGVDAIGRPFLFLTALVWLLAGIYARAYLRGDPRAHAFLAFFLATEAGNLGLCVALDAASFYFAFALMSFAAYGLVVHDGTREAMRAGRVYLVMVVIGEAFLVAAFILAVNAADTHLLPELGAALAAAHRPDVAALFLTGFGVKAGVLLLHVWLPLAHPVAPVPASAVLSGAIIKGGLLGWLRFLPLGGDALPEIGAATLVAGLAAAFYGVGVGLAQSKPKVVLAYSSISQMGWMTAGVGAGLLAPQAWPLLLPAVSFYAVHHALNKSALFLGAGVVREHGGQPWVLLALIVPAATIAGAPWTSGAMAKDALKKALHELPGRWPPLLEWLLPLAAFATALLLVRFLFVVAREHGEPGGKVLGLRWSLSLAAVVAFSGWSLRGDEDIHIASATWPLLAAALCAAVARRQRRRAPQVPPGDVLVVAEDGLKALRQMLAGSALPRLPATISGRGLAWDRVERVLSRWPVAGGLWLALFAVLIAALVAAS